MGIFHQSTSIFPSDSSIMYKPVTGFNFDFKRNQSSKFLKTNSSTLKNSGLCMFERCCRPTRIRPGTRLETSVLLRVIRTKRTIHFLMSIKTCFMIRMSKKFCRASDNGEKSVTYCPYNTFPAIFR